MKCYSCGNLAYFIYRAYVPGHGLHVCAGHLKKLVAAIGEPQQLDVIERGALETVWNDQDGIDYLVAFGSMIRRATGSKPLYMNLQFSDNDPLQAISDYYASAFSDRYFEVTKVFHLTMLYVLAASDSELAEFEAMVERIVSIYAPFDIKLESVEIFDVEGDETPVILLVNGDPLRQMQIKLFEAAKSMGLAVSPYSVPSRWIPHITILYGLEKEAESELPNFQPSGRVIGDKVIISRPEYEIVAQFDLKGE